MIFTIYNSGYVWYNSSEKRFKVMSRPNYKDTRMKCDLFYLDNPEFAEEPWKHPSPPIHVVETFRVKTFNEAIEYTKKYNSEHTDHRYFWMHRHETNDFGLWHDDGVCSWGLSDVDNYFVDKIAKERVKIKKLDKDDPERKTIVRKIAKLRRRSVNKFIRFLVKSCIAVSDWCGWYLKDKWVEKFKDWKWGRERLAYWKKNRHDIQESWNLELHMLGDLKWNLKKLNECGYGLNSEFIQDIVMEDHKDEPNFDYKAFMEKFWCGGSVGDVEDRAIQRQKETYEHICHLVDLYTFYYNSEVDDEEVNENTRTEDMREIYVPETYDMVDYMAMSEKGKEAWNEIWDLVKKYGQQMND